MWVDAVLFENAIVGLEGDLSSNLQDAVVTRTRHGTQSGRGSCRADRLEVSVVHYVERLAPQLEVDTFMNFEVSEEADVEMIEARPIDCAALLIANLNRCRSRRDECRSIKPVQAGVNLLAVAIVWVQHLIWSQGRWIGTVHDAQSCRVIHLAAIR